MSNDPSGRPANPDLNVLPNVGISEILGLVELLKNKGGTEDIYKLANELKMEFGDTLTVIRAAEILGLVHTPGGDVVLEKKGDAVVQSKIVKERKSIVREQMNRLPVFVKIREYLLETDDQQAKRDGIIQKLAELIPNENAEQMFNVLINWGRYGEIFGYNDDTEMVYLDHTGGQ